MVIPGGHIVLLSSGAMLRPAAPVQVFAYASQTTFPSYGYFLELGYTTWPERWDVKSGDSLMHGCGSLGRHKRGNGLITANLSPTTRNWPLSALGFWDTKHRDLHRCHAISLGFSGHYQDPGIYKRG